MILILTDTDEPTTDYVIDWLNYFQKHFVRISSTDKLLVKSIYSSEQGLEAIFEYQKNEEIVKIDTKVITSYWYRRSALGWSFKEVESTNKKMDSCINDFLFEEYSCAIRTINFILNSKNRINVFEDNSINKMEVLQVAKNTGLKVPESIVCSEKTTLNPFYFKHEGQIVTKSIGDPSSFFFENLHQLTSKVKWDDIPNTFGLSLFQEQLEKNIELRIFFLKDIFYGTAIFSQMSDNTKIDLKNYDLTNPNRVVPYEVPKEIEVKLRKLMLTLNLKSGSIDMVLTPNFEYAFLEVNPIGQFEQVAFPLNVDLFRIIAEML